MNEIILSLSFALAMLISLRGTPVAKKVAFRYKILDIPDGKLKTHRQPLPYLGGMIVYFASFFPISLLLNFSRELLGILFAGSILILVGLFDDLKALSPGIKFLFQIIATYILVKSGIRINLAFLSFYVNAALTFFWILTIINAINIIDIMDGLASGIGLVSALIIFSVSLFSGNFLISILSISLAGALIGFLKFNWSPASIYLGDSGSMFLGMMIGSMSIMLDYTPENDLGFISAFLVVLYPLFDIIYVILLRILHGKSPFMGSPDHTALRLRKKMSLSDSQTVFYIALFQSIMWIPVILNYTLNIRCTIISTLAVSLFLSLTGFWLADEKMT